MGVLILVVRVALGALFIVAGVLKAHDGIVATTASVAAYRLLPQPLVALLGVVLPYFEIFLGAYLVAGLFTRIAGYVAALQLAIFGAAVASLLVRHINADCGCLGSGVSVPPSWAHVGADLALAALALLVALRPPGALAVDTALAKKSAFDPAQET